MPGGCDRPGAAAADGEAMSLSEVAHLPMAALNRLDRHLRELLRGAAIAMGLRGVAAVAEFAFTLLLARLLGADGAGAFFLASTVALVGTVFGRLGLDNALVRHIAENAAVRDWAAVKGVARHGERLGLSASLAMALALYLSAAWLASEVFRKADLADPLRLMALAVAPWAMVRLYGEMQRGLKHIAAYLTIHSAGYRLLALLLLAPLVASFGLEGAIASFVAATLVMTAAGAALWRLQVRRLPSGPARFPLRRLLDSSIPLFWVQPATQAMTWVPTLLLGAWSSAADVGVYSAAARTVLLSILVLVAVNAIAAPKFAALWRNGDRDGLRRSVLHSGRLLLVLSAPIFLLFIFAPGVVMGLFGGAFAEQGAPFLAIMALGQFVNVATGSIVPLLAMSGNERLVRNNVAFGALASLALCVALIPGYGALGAAVATSASLALVNIAGAYLVWSRLGFVTVPMPAAWRRRLEGCSPAHKGDDA
jgi:O-antigen/teichoic acid export membrane protein